MSVSKTFAVAVTALLLSTPGAALAQRTVSGEFRGSSWTASNRIVGALPTGDANGGGSPIYFANNGAYKGVVSLIMDYGAGGRFICSGTLISARHILTAAHCVSNGAGTANPLTTTAYFLESGDPNNRYHSDGTATAVTVRDYFVNSEYTGEVIDQNDIAVLSLSQAAPEWATIYGLSDEADLLGDKFNIAGFGGRSDIGGAFGNNTRTGYLRQGDNSYSYRWGDERFGGFFTDRDANGENFFGKAEVDFSWVSDFDNGLATNDTACRIAAAVGAPVGFGCEVGVSPLEVGVAGGDSGGPQFINGKIASVTSYGLTFGAAFGDFRPGLNSSWGEFNGYVPVNIHRDFIAGALAAPVPEPSTWALMLVGFGAVGGMIRGRVRAKNVVYA